MLEINKALRCINNNQIIDSEIFYHLFYIIIVVNMRPTKGLKAANEQVFI